MCNSDVLISLRIAKSKILEALEKGASIVKEIEIRGRIVKHNDLVEELKKINILIKEEEAAVNGTTRYKPARNRARIGR